MSDNMVTLAQQKEAAEKRAAEKKRSALEARNKWLIPASALIVANIIFLSLDIRAFQAIYILTNSYLLATQKSITTKHRPASPWHVPSLQSACRACWRSRIMW
jgi:hypothetical protein